MAGDQSQHLAEARRDSKMILISATPATPRGMTRNAGGPPAGLRAARPQFSDFGRSAGAVADHELMLRTVEIYEDARLDFAEAYLAAVAELSGVKRVVSFDRQIDRVKSVQRVEP